MFFFYDCVAKKGVTDLHCLHVWSLTLGRTVVSAHIKATDPEEALASAHEICEAMGVAHSTIQVNSRYRVVGVVMLTGTEAPLRSLGGKQPSRKKQKRSCTVHEAVGVVARRCALHELLST